MSKAFVLVAVACSLVAAASTSAAQSLGSKEPGLFNLKGEIYFLGDDVRRMPENLAEMKAEGVIYANELNVPTREFTGGFPGITDRFEWFAIRYTGQFQLLVEGEYRWRLNSDDGSRLWIDGKDVVDNDGMHATESKEATISLSKGTHSIEVWYYQGPATEIALQLFVQPPGGAEGIFKLSDFSGELKSSMARVHAEPTPDGIRVRLDAAILFDTGKSELKPEAHEAIAAVSDLIAAYPQATVRVSGYTDATGDDASNLQLSDNRAVAVKTALVASNPPPGVTFETHGFGKADPVASNKTPAGRAKNRRVELFIKP